MQKIIKDAIDAEIRRAYKGWSAQEKKAAKKVLMDLNKDTTDPRLLRRPPTKRASEVSCMAGLPNLAKTPVQLAVE